MKGLIIRKENSADFGEVEDVVKEAFLNMTHSDHSEHLLIARLRKSPAFIPDLSFVAESEGEIVGHILISKITIVSPTENFEGLSLAPVSVAPNYQNKGIGTELIKKAHLMANHLGYLFIVLIGHENYYPRFGYQESKSFEIEFAFDIPAKNCMVLELQKGALSKISGSVTYPKEFFE